MSEVEFNPEVIDGDNDGIAQDDAVVEAPTEDVEVAPVAEESPVEEVAEVAPVVEEAPAPEPEVILAEEPAEELQALTPVENGVIGTGTVKRKAPAKKAEPQVVEESNTIAVYSSKNLHWPGVGSLLRGYSILSASVADKWVSRNRNVRLATPEEIAQEFGK
jgi:hypothetical protein